MNVNKPDRGIASRKVGSLDQYNWTPSHERILLYMNQATDRKIIATRLKISSATLSRIIREPYFKQRLSELQDALRKKFLDNQLKNLDDDGVQEARKVLVGAAVRAAEKIKYLSQAGMQENKVQLDACKDILDRVGLKAIEVIETRERVVPLSEVESAKQTLGEVTTIFERLETQSSPFILGKDALGSSDTDEALDVQVQGSGAS